jgi:predicted nuclease of restriction endonuclease-like RecB superfamily
MEELWTKLTDLFYQWGGPSVVIGIFGFWFKTYLKKRDEREKKTEKLIMLMLSNTRANNVLAVATAKAVQRIPDAHCNGDMTEALEKAAKIQEEEKDLLMDEGIKHIFGD